MYDGVLEYKEGVLFYSPSCNRKKFGFKNKKELQNEVENERAQKQQLQKNF